MDDLLQEFIAETRETLEALSGEIVAWEAQPDDRARLDAIFRFVHTVKGSCGFLDLPRLARLSHAAEDVLAQVRSGNRTPDRALVNGVLAVVDRIGEIVEAIDAGTGLDDSGDDLLIAALAEGAQEVVQLGGAVAQRAPARSVRLNVDLLDRMMSGMSDMVLARNELARRLRAEDIDPAIEAALERLSLTVGEMRDTVTRTRMQKIDALFSALPRMVRDTAAGLGKSVTLHIEGADVELDREMIEVMRDPLVHIVRNAIDHGIEAPGARRTAGKRENGRLVVAARQSGNQIIVEIADDGRGIDVERLIAKAAAAGHGSENELRALSEKARLALVFLPGLSSKDEVTEISGRGVGMDVVRASIEQIGGRVELDNAPGKGLRIAIHVPLTLSIISAIVVGAGGQRFAIPRQAIEEIVTERGDAIRIDMVGGARIATVRDRRIPLIGLGRLLGISADARDEGQMLAIVNIGKGSYALAVDTVLDNEELVIKPASPAVMSTGLYAGQTLPDSGLPMLMLDVAGMAAVAGLDFSRGLGDAGADEDAAGETEVPGVPALLFADLDGVRRAVPLGIVDRVEQIDAIHIRNAAGRLRVAIDGRILPMLAQDRLPDGRVSLLRLKDGESEVAYAIEDALDIVVLPEEVIPARAPGPVGGVVLLDGEQVELLDAFWIFAEYGAGAEDGPAPLCLLAGDGDGWMAAFVRPLLESAGYRVVSELAAGETPNVVLAAAEAEGVEGQPAPLVRLRRRKAAAGKADESIYRYDRDGLLAAIESRVANGGSR
ncbi:chemotaxis protein CheA [Sphingomonas canadensis]|uniref:histidine kinase n=1 Tax=Sphingomonas canadensis TaxID=1219257 RepID=A0ABW3H730_9SPHN|nr:chemotaxis protein CheW [Sphingomonas canadensis]MCW3835595.1 chemotaxis protein CheW [Sphingomonas canadensis]